MSLIHPCKVQSEFSGFSHIAQEPQAFHFQVTYRDFFQAPPKVQINVFTSQSTPEK